MEQICADGFDALPELVRTMVNAAMYIERQKHLGHVKYLYLDARYEKVRQNGQVRDSAVLLAVGVNNEGGNREVLGVSVSLGEHEVHWRNFLGEVYTGCATVLLSPRNTDA